MYAYLTSIDNGSKHNGTHNVEAGTIASHSSTPINMSGMRVLHRFELLICVHSTDRYPIKASVQASPHGPVYSRACRKGLSRWEPYRHAATSWEQPRVLSFGCLLTAATLSQRGMSDAAAGFAPGALSVDAGIPKAPLLASIV